MRISALLKSALVIVGVSSGAPAVKAAFFQNGTGLSGPISTVTFDEIILPFLTQVTTQYDSLGVSFSPFGHYFPASNGSAQGNLTGLNSVSNFIPYGYGGSAFAMDVIFSAPVTEAALQAIGPSDATATFTAYLGGNLVESVSAALEVGGPARYYGFDGILFDRINISPYAPSGDPFGAGWRSPLILDNIQRADAASPPPPQVPGPLPWLGAAAAFGYSRKLRKRIKGSTTPKVTSAIG
jgi:hypothetical protein